MDTNPTKPNEISQLARGLSTACKKAAAQSKTAAYTAPVILATLVVLTNVSPKANSWA